MLSRVHSEQLKSDLILPWVILSIMLVMLAVYIIVCQTIGEQLRQPFPEAQRVLIRTILYVVAIVTFPMTNLIRYIQLRLNQTMPYFRSEHDYSMDSVSEAIAVAKSRYLVTIIVSMALIESIGVFGFIMFILGDNFNTLYIFTGLSALGFYLYRPKTDEYLMLIETLAAQNHDDIG
jgi:hypothetical protein